MATTTTPSTPKPNQQIDRAKDEAQTAADKVKEAASHAGQAVTSAASATGQVVGQKIDDATTAVGSGMRNLADTVRKNGPGEGMIGSATHGVASALETGGKYLEEKHLSDMGQDVTNVIKQYPIPAVLVGLGVGFLLGRAVRS